MIIPRRKTRTVKVGSLSTGGDFPVIIQSMCSTRTEDVDATVAQILGLEKEECEMVRIAVPNFEAAANIPAIKSKIHIPLVADIHFDYRLALESIKQGADKIRINPGNIGGEDRMAQILREAKRCGVAMRLGVNAGSLEQRLWDKYGRPSPEALTESALDWIKIFEKYEFTNFVISLKSSDVPETVRAYQLLALQCDYPFHLGITEAGLPPYGSIKSAVGIGALLLQGIGDTIRVSISADPVEEIKVCKQILKSLHLYTKEPEVISCPTCGRIEIDLIKHVKEIESRLIKIGKPIKVSVMGCVVNGPGEAREADWGIAGGRKQGVIFRKGKVVKWVAEDKLVDEFMKMVTSNE
ncbi:flavodoxin-dependent (E)-4-hydroxy-3-methylbut-2-enyl-diphosphate synthase [Candidatus Peregrinibacteria bacterium]|nr:flavodoxin-dependent (E)-4-hydroxy-3-methylbut-2-enyl-diphosphate synthase [Candidatus Peregrinibacteria bacterium]